MRLVRVAGEWRTGKPANTIGTMAYPPHEQVPPGPPPWPAAPSVPRRGASVLGVVGSVLGLLGLIAGVAAWLRPLPTAESSAPVYSEEQVADAKKAVCEAYGEVKQALTASSNKDGVDNPAANLAIAVNVRLALYAGSDYLLSVLQAHPATADELRHPAEDIAAVYKRVSVKQIGEVPRADLDHFADQAKTDAARIEAACQ